MKETEKLVFLVNDLLTIQIRNRKLKRYVSKELLIWEIFVFTNFNEL